MADRKTPFRLSRREFAGTTLGPYLKGHGATSFTLKGQEVSGILGPIRLLA
ncbi:MAG: hypothetical protein LLG20_04590 [Acidobacteriales bacterium]|nr:hypothetical protein [Terriglobales bacterium]